ncbi:hypothetical protein AB0C01_07970 [Micromonospora sp. NPDC048905]|uniref:hypothetical protein n=1 Tax=Micromonospora sp. NPDC048905 TaxID=3155494 RepID=UPI0033DB42B3
MLLDELEKQRGQVVDLRADYYWTISPQEAFRFEGTKPPEATLGQLSDDLGSMRDMLASNVDHPVVWHDLAHLIGILSRLAALDLPTREEPHTGT